MILFDRPVEPVGSLLAVANLAVRYVGDGSADIIALRGVSFSLDAGETLVVVGPNGSGKSTLLHAIAGSLRAHVSGSVELAGDPLLTRPAYRRARSLAMVHQDPMRGTAARLTLGEHCALTAARDDRRPVSWAMVADRLKTAGTALDPDRPAAELSGGQRQLFALMLAVLAGPRLLLLDEPTAALDARHGALVRHVIGEFSDRADAAAVLVTHDLEEALGLGNRLLVLSARGEPHVLLDRDAKSSLDETALRELLTRATSAAWT